MVRLDPGGHRTHNSDIARIRISSIESPLIANVWKLHVQEGDNIKANQTVVTLEAMKLEIDVRAEVDTDGWIVEMLLVKPNDIVNAGQPLLLIRATVA
jgi:urea carboxylase